MNLAIELIIALALFALAFNLVTYGLRRHWLRRSSEIGYERLAPMHAFWSFVIECGCLMLATASVPIGWVLPVRRGAAGPKGAVVLVHGWGLNGACFLLLERRLRRDGWGPILLFNYATLLGDFDAAAAKLAVFLDRYGRTAAPPVALIGHSLGGLVVRAYARRADTVSPRRLVTLGSPHYGTRLAELTPLLRRLKPGSAALQRLGDQDDVPARFDVIAIASAFAAMIVPPSNAVYPNAFNIQINDVGHNGLLYSAKLYGLIAENLDAPLPEPSATP